MKLKSLKHILDNHPDTPKMPLLFLGHGSPMNAIEENEFVAGFRRVAAEIPRPSSIICISAHWETRGTYLSAAEKPSTIHDFYGFPGELYKVQYPAPGNPELARDLQKNLNGRQIVLDNDRGLDHGAWSVIKHLYPEADIPVLQMSIDSFKSPEYHAELARELAGLRKKGVLIVGSGNIVHNLAMVDWRKLDVDDYAYDWAEEAREKINKFILNDKLQDLINYRSKGRAVQMAIPSPEHYLPLIYILALKDEEDNVKLFNDKAVAGSLTMTSVRINGETES